MKSISRDDIINGGLTGLFILYTWKEVVGTGMNTELQVRFEKMGYPFDLGHEGYGGDMKIKGLLYRDENYDYFFTANMAPFLRSDIPNTTEGWIQYFVDAIKNPTNFESNQIQKIPNLTRQDAWGDSDWRFVLFKGRRLDVWPHNPPWKPSQGIINWGKKWIPISSRKEEK